MMEYQQQAIAALQQALPAGARTILEIGSDLQGETALGLAEATACDVIGVNPIAGFPESRPRTATTGRMVALLRADGRALPVRDESVDAVFSVATMEHVVGLDSFLGEVHRVLKPRGAFFTFFGPLWSSATGHHVYARVGEREARFWKPGRNPIPDFAHLLMSRAEMRIFLKSGPCCDELVEPILEWIYDGDSINRCYLEDYSAAFERCALEIEWLELHPGPAPDPKTLQELRDKHGPRRNFGCNAVTALLRKLPSDCSPESERYRRLFHWSRALRTTARDKRALGWMWRKARALPGSGTLIRGLRAWKRRQMGLLP